MIEILAVRNCKYMNADNSIIECEAKFGHLGDSTQDWLPFAEMPDLRNIALTGQEADDSRYLALTQGEGSIPQYVQPVGNDAVVNFGGGGSRGGGGRGGGGGG